MNQEKELLEKLIKSIYVNRANFDNIGSSGLINGTLLEELRRIIPEYANELLKLRLGEVVKKIQTVKIDLSDSAYASGLEYGLALSITIIDKTLKELDQ